MSSDSPHLPTNREELPGFFRGALSWRGSVTPRILPTLLVFCAYALLLESVDHYWRALPHLSVTPFEFTGAVLGLVLVFRTNAGHDRWWEARKLWGGIVNQCRNLMLAALSYGPDEKEWRQDVVNWTIAFAFAAKESLRRTDRFEELQGLLSASEIEALRLAPHMPNFASANIARLLQEARSTGRLDGFAFHQMEEQRVELIDYIGGCERILKTPMPLVYAIKVRRFILLFLLLLPFSLIREPAHYAVFIFALVAYPLLSLDRIGLELQNPFSSLSLSHLPLSDICRTIKSNGLALSQGGGDSVGG
ncbi:MAG: bestrophin family protein [Gammaproteobacteria bacterium]